MLRAIETFAEAQNLEELIFVGRGLEAAVWSGLHPRWGRVALKVYMGTATSHPNAYTVGTEEIAKSEQRAMQEAYRLKLPVPQVYEVTEHPGRTISVQSFLQGEHPERLPDYEMGRLIRLLHEGRTEVKGLVGMEHSSLQATLCERTMARLAHLRAKVNTGVIPDVKKSEFYDSLEDRSRPALLHMDLRPSNILVTREGVSAILDWSNALMGPPSLEIARLRMYGHYSQQFLDGYGFDPTEDVSIATNLAHEIDTLAMLGVVHSTEAKDQTAFRDVIDKLVTTITRWREARHA